MGDEGTSDGLKKMMIGLALFLAISIADIPIMFIERMLFNALIDSGSSISFYIMISALLGLAEMIVRIVAVVFIGIGLYRLRRVSKGVGNSHMRNMDLSIKFYWLFVASLVAPFLLNFLYFDISSGETAWLMWFSAVLFIRRIIGWIGFLSLVLLLALPLREIARRRQKELAFVFVSGSIVMSFFNASYIAVVYLFYWETMAVFYQNLFFQSFISLIYIVLYFAIFTAYRDTMRLRDEKKSMYVRRGSLWSRPLPLYERFERDLSRPLRMIMILLVAGILLSSVFIVGNYLEMKGFHDRANSGGGSSGSIVIGEPETQIEMRSATGLLNEGQTDEYEIDLGAYPVRDIQITLTWWDEPDVRRYENTPDEFTIVTTMTDDPFEPWEQEENGMNEQGGSGELFIQYTADENRPFNVDGFVIQKVAAVLSEGSNTSSDCWPAPPGSDGMPRLVGTHGRVG
ncbi:MAG: hypothetical protein ACMUHY_09190, partial [Thermoplasmatota archaeon]